MPDPTAAVALDHAAGDEIVEQESSRLGRELVGAVLILVVEVGVVCHERAVHGGTTTRAVNASHVKSGPVDWL